MAHKRKQGDPTKRCMVHPEAARVGRRDLAYDVFYTRPSRICG